MSIAFSLHVESNNDAFAEEPATELARMLRKLAGEIEQGLWDDRKGYSALLDYNGNTVGRFKFHTES
jgi:hypothetical protein